MRTNGSIPRRRLGQTDLEVTPIGLGVMQFSGGKGVFGKMFPDLTQDQKNAIVKTALDGGINWFDTAEIYGRGRSERGLANALRAADKLNEEVVVATKWFPLFRTASNIASTIHDRIHFLDGYNIDLYMVHQPWGFSTIEAQMVAMADLVDTGLIRSVGVSNFNVKQMQRAHSTLRKRGLHLAVNQVQFSLLNRKIESSGVLQAAKDMGITIVAWSPLARGLLSGKYHRDPELVNQKPFIRRKMIQRYFDRLDPLIPALDKIAVRHDATTAQIALNWLIHFHGETVLVIPGATGVQQAEQSAGAMSFKLSEEEMALLDELSRPFR